MLLSHAVFRRFIEDKRHVGPDGRFLSPQAIALTLGKPWTTKRVREYLNRGYPQLSAEISYQAIINPLSPEQEQAQLQSIRAATQAAREAALEAERQEALRRERAERSRNYRERMWRSDVLRTGRYKGDKVPAEVLHKMRQLTEKYWRTFDASRPFDMGAPLAPVVAQFNYDGTRVGSLGLEGSLAWEVHADGVLTLSEGR